MWVRGDRADYDDWARLTNDQRWSYAGLLSYFRRVESRRGSTTDSAQHGFVGPMHTASGTREYPLRVAVHSALREVGHQDSPDANAGQPLGIGMWTENWRDNKRQPAGLAYPLDKAQVLTDSLVRRVLLSDETPPRATGIELVSGEIVKASREVIVSCGALRTPQLLMLSGIGAPAELAKHDIPLRVANEGVGANLSDHVSLIQFWRLKDELAARGVAAGSERFSQRPEASQGLPFDFVTTAAIPAEKMASALQPDNNNARQPWHSRAHFELMVAYTLLERGNPAFSAPFDGTHISTAVLLLQPTSRGSITLASNDPAVNPLVDPAYLATTTDQTTMREGVRSMLRVAERLIEDGVLEAETPPVDFPPLHSETSSDDEIDVRIRHFAATMYRPCASCAMGAAVDSELRVGGVRSLRVVDASIFPTAVAGHPQQAVYAVAEQAVDFLLGGIHVEYR